MNVSQLTKLGLVVAVLSTPILTACSSGGFGVTGNSVAQIADISGYGNPTANEALRLAKQHFLNRNYGYSAAFYKRYVELAPNDAEGYVGLGASYDRLGRFDLSDRVYASLLRIDGESAQYYNNVGYSNMLRGNLGQAYEHFRRARALDPDNVIIQNNLQMLADVAAA